MHKDYPRNMTAVCINGWKNILLGAACGIFCLFCKLNTMINIRVHIVLAAPKMIKTNTRSK